jgi:hypothetical protein
VRDQHEGHAGRDRQNLEQLPERFEAAGGGSDADHRDQVVPDLLTFGAPRLRVGLGARLLGISIPPRLCALNGLVHRRVSTQLWRTLFFAHSHLHVFSRSYTYAYTYAYAYAYAYDGSMMAIVE